MLFRCLTKDQDVAKIAAEKILPNPREEYVCGALKSSRRIAELKMPSYRSVNSAVRGKGSSVLVSHLLLIC